MHHRSSSSTYLEWMTSSKWTFGSCVPYFQTISSFFADANRCNTLPSPLPLRLPSKDGAPSFRHTVLQADSQYNCAEEQGKGGSRDEASDRATELRRSRDRICRYAHGRSQQRCIGLSRLCVMSAYISVPRIKQPNSFATRRYWCSHSSSYRLISDS